MIQTQRLTLIPAPLDAIESLIRGETSYQPFYDQVAEGYLEFPAALEYTAERLRNDSASAEWGTYLFVLDRCLIGVGGYKGAPDDVGSVEIGYGIAVAFRNKGYATEAAQGLINHAFRMPQVTVVIAHTLAEQNASGEVLLKCGMRRVAEIDDPDDGLIWRWEVRKSGAS
jgi:RimJ/RimL family protein N-acetyltransferase